MKILLHCDFNRGSIADRFGLAEYSYWFVHEAYRQTLAGIGDVHVIRDASEADAIWAECNARGERCLLLSFNPPHKTPLGLSCPTVPVFAWEFPNLPRAADESCWNNDPRFDWAGVFRQMPGAICLSQHSVDAVRRQLGNDYRITAIPTALWDHLAALREAVATRDASRVLRVDAPVVDSRLLGLNADGHIIPELEDTTPFSPEDAALLPAHPARFGDGWIPPKPTLVASTGAQPQVDDGTVEPVPCGHVLPPKLPIRTELGRVVYTSVLTPSDGRKNWLAIISAFVWALRDAEDATLLLKTGGGDPAWHHFLLLDSLTRLSPFKCRILVVHGMVDDVEYARLIANTDFYVNASLCEGLCMPLMEYLCSGIPAIAPNHTAMADYISSDNAFVVDSHDGESTMWPFGDMERARTTRPQVDWHALMQAFRESYVMATTDQAAWGTMSARAIDSMRRYCADDICVAKLREFLEGLLLHAPRTAEMHA